MHCRLCNSNNIRYKFTLSGNHKIYTCKDCTVEFMDPQLNDEEIKDLYSESYYKSWGISGDKENESSRLMKIATFRLRLKRVLHYISSGKVLDVGCATGYFLELAQSEGFKTYGIEISAYSAAMAAKKFGTDNIFNGKLEECPFPKKSFHLISMFDLIEHVRMPSQTLAKAGSLLEDNGLIIISTPDTGSLSHRLMHKRWTHYKKEHFYYFNLASIAYIAKENKLDIIYSEKSKKALNINYLYTQWQIYPHWLFTPLIRFLHFILPASITNKCIYLGIGELTVILKKASSEN